MTEDEWRAREYRRRRRRWGCGHKTAITLAITLAVAVTLLRTKNNKTGKST